MQLGSGAWGQRADSERGNTIATAQVLAVLQRTGFAHWHPAVQRATEYLATETLEHARQVELGGRGSYARYVAYALRGMGEFPEVRRSARVRKALEEQVDWLLDRQVSGGWAEAPGETISALATAQVVSALRLLGAPFGSVDAGAGVLMELRHPGGYWQLHEEGGPPSPAVTAECILALRGLSAEVDADLDVAAEWLASNRRLWLRQVERQQIPGATWDHPSYVLPAKALAACGGDREAVAVAQEIVAELWDPGQAGWLFPGEDTVSAKGAAAAVICLDAVRASVRLGRAGRPAPGAEGDSGPGYGRQCEWEIELRPKPDVLVRAGDFRDLIALRTRHWELLEALLEEAERVGGGEFLVRDRVVAAMAIGSSSLTKEMSRLAEALARETGGRLSRVAVGAGRGRWRLAGRISRPAAPPLVGSAREDRDELDAVGERG